VIIDHGHLEASRETSQIVDILFSGHVPGRDGRVVPSGNLMVVPRQPA
jgi:hypothetical protein